MELRQLRQFVTLAETLNFHRAAERLNMAQPPLSVSIKKLEQEIGVRLFDRDQREVKLTEAGHAALREAQTALRHAREVSRVARAVGAGETGRVRLGFAASATFALLPKLLPLVRDRHPNVTLELREGTNTQLLAYLERQEIDIGLVRVPTEFPPAIELLTIEHDVLVAAIPATNALARQARLTLSDLDGEPLVGHAASGPVPGLRAATRRLFDDAGLRPQIAQEALQIHTVISLVESGLGIALVPSVSVRYASDSVVFRRFEDVPPSAYVGIALAYRPQNESLAARRLREIAVETLVLAP